MLTRAARNCFRQYRAALGRSAYSTECKSHGTRSGIVLGVYQNGTSMEFSREATAFNDRLGGLLEKLVASIGVKQGDALLLNNLDKEYPNLAVANLGPTDVGMDANEYMDLGKENVRQGIGKAVVLVTDEGATKVFVDGLNCPETVAESATLAAWKFEGTKSMENQTANVTVEALHRDDRELFERGTVFGGVQNLARLLTEIPANILTPNNFAEQMIRTLCPCGITVDIQDRDWIEAKKLNGLLEASKGSCEQPLFAVLCYTGGNDSEKPIALTAHATTFDTGGACLRECDDMAYKKRHVASAATIVGVMKGISQLSLPINVNAYIPLFESSTSGTAMHPSDVLHVQGGRSVHVDHTKFVSRLAMADTLAYASSTNPRLVVHACTLSQIVHSVFGELAAPLFTNSPQLWKELERAGALMGDRTWMFPRYDRKRQMMINDPLADVAVLGEGGVMLDDLPKSAAFANEFIDNLDYVHLDVAGVSKNTDEVTYPYLRKEFATGRMTRTLLQFIYQLSCPHDPPPPPPSPTRR
ncbi:cytosol aminopeptidase-like [Adelges cooleyi]|uniref:cytosol aminopeptidase-like n=1 Tax=Adelges cooleyi TaxID=133065 RepID=UPI0021808FDD|nr:cytosol aminopeptidase-like [Adelges cooleyi]XP_050440062.1 cytosol aminopeptidase-like [Adelges cooleyi]